MNCRPDEYLIKKLKAQNAWNMNNIKDKIGIRAINIISVVIVLVVMIMLGLRQKPYIGEWTKQLTFVNAIINSSTAFFLLLGLYFIKRRDIAKHRLCMTAGFLLGGLFLVFYVLYHISNEATPFGGEGAVRYFYFFVLISHVLASFCCFTFSVTRVFLRLEAHG